MRRHSAKKLCDLELEVAHSTDKAWLVSDGKTQVWLPKSQVEYDEDTGIFTMPIALAQEKELI